jgi:phosphatidylglycerophosphate synthase
VTGAGDSPTLAEALDPSAPVLVLAPDALPDAAWLRDRLADAVARPVRTTWLSHGRSAATFYPDALSLLGALPGGYRDFPHQALSDPDAARVEAPRDAWSDLKDPDVVRRIERGLFRSLRQPSDGYLARNDRALSIALSRVLIRTPMTPNGITALSLIVGLVGAVLLAQPTWGIAMGGALALWACCILDGCDGEVARIKLLASPSGARFDTVADNIVHLATFVAVAQHVHGVRPDLGLAGPATLLLTGMLLSMASVWWLINRSPPEQRAGFPRVFERIASRDYIYLVVALTAVERLHWFVWAAALGANAFWLSLWWWTLGRRRR